MVPNCRVIQPILRAEVPNCADSRVDPTTNAERTRNPHCTQGRIQLVRLALHLHRHRHTTGRILLRTICLRIAKKSHHRITDVLVNGGTMRDRYLGHLIQVGIEGSGEDFWFKLVGDLCEGGNIREEDRQELAIRPNPDFCFPRKN